MEKVIDIYNEELFCVIDKKTKNAIIGTKKSIISSVFNWYLTEQNTLVYKDKQAKKEKGILFSTQYNKEFALIKAIDFLWGILNRYGYFKYKLKEL